jgi:hypothetical protein
MSKAIKTKIFQGKGQQICYVIYLRDCVLNKSNIFITRSLQITEIRSSFELEGQIVMLRNIRIFCVN